MGDTSQTHFRGCRKIRQQTQRWHLAEQEVETKEKIDTEYINERAISTTIVVNRQRIKLMSVYFPHSRYADHHIEKMYKTIEKHTANYKRYKPSIGGDLVHGTECISVGRYTLTLADVTRLHSIQHDVQENTSETNDLRFSKRKRKSN